MGLPCTSIASCCCKDNPGYMPVHAAPATPQLSWHPPASGMGLRNPTASWKWLRKGSKNRHTSRHKMKKNGFFSEELPLDLQFRNQEHTQQLNSTENITLVLFSQLLFWMLLSGLLLQYPDCVSLTCSWASWCINTVIWSLEDYRNTQCSTRKLQR